MVKISSSICDIRSFTSAKLILMRASAIPAFCPLFMSMRFTLLRDTRGTAARAASPAGFLDRSSLLRGEDGRKWESRVRGRMGKVRGRKGEDEVVGVEREEQGIRGKLRRELKNIYVSL